MESISLFSRFADDHPCPSSSQYPLIFNFCFLLRCSPFSLLSFFFLQYNRNLKENFRNAHLTQWASSTAKPANCPWNLCNKLLYIIKGVQLTWKSTYHHTWNWRVQDFKSIKLTFLCRHFRISWNDKFPATLSGVTYRSLQDGLSFLETFWTKYNQIILTWK